MIVEAISTFLYSRALQGGMAPTSMRVHLLAGILGKEEEVGGCVPSPTLFHRCECSLELLRPSGGPLN